MIRRLLDAYVDRYSTDSPKPKRARVKKKPPEPSGNVSRVR